MLTLNRALTDFWLVDSAKMHFEQEEITKMQEELFSEAYLIHAAVKQFKFVRKPQSRRKTQAPHLFKLSTS